MKAIKIFFTISLIILSLCCCDTKEYHTRSKINLIEETTVTTITEKTSDTAKVPDKVYYTESGKSYHYVNPCGKGTYYECTLEEAIKNGLTPCKKCVK